MATKLRLGACLWFALVASCVGPDLEPPGGGSDNESAPGKAAGGSGSADHLDAAVPPSKPGNPSAAGSGGSRATVSDQDAGAADAGDAGH